MTTKSLAAVSGFCTVIGVWLAAVGSMIWVNIPFCT